MDNRVRRNAESVSVTDDEMISPAEPVQPNPMQVAEKQEKHQRWTEQDVSSWTIKAKQQRELLEKSHRDRYEIALDVAAVDDKPPEVKSAYLETLFGKIDDPLASIYRTIGKCSLLHEESTIAVIGHLPVHVAIQFARMKPNVQTRVLDYFRKHPESKPPSRERLKEARRAGEIKPRKPRAPQKAPVPEEATPTSSGSELAVLGPEGDEPFDKWDDSKRQRAIAWLQKTERDALTVGLRLKLLSTLTRGARRHRPRARLICRGVDR